MPKRVSLRVVTDVSDPPALTPEDIASVREESDRLGSEFRRRTASMDRPTAEDMRTLIGALEFARVVRETLPVDEEADRLVGKLLRDRAANQKPRKIGPPR